MTTPHDQPPGDATTPTPTPTLLLLGGGGHAAVVADAARAAGLTVLGALDDGASDAAPSRGPAGVVTLGAIADLDVVRRAHPQITVVHAAVGDATLRRRWLDAIDDDALAAPLVHPAAVVSPTATLEPGVFIGARAVVNAHAHLGRGVIINTGAIVEHDVTLDAFAHIAPGATIAGGVTIGADTLIGVNASVVPRVRIGARVIVGAGAVVADDLPDDVTAVGVPARVIDTAGLDRDPRW